MKKDLTTGQMIDALEHDEIAVNNIFGTYVTRKSFGFFWCEKDGSYSEKKYFVISDMVVGAKWTIL